MKITEITDIDVIER